jgi:hypothetical protein
MNSTNTAYQAPNFRISTSGSHLGFVIPPPHSSTEAYLLLEAAQSDSTISRMRKDLAHEIIHRNTITLQLNRLFFDNSQNDLCAADEFVGHVRLSL